MEIVIRTVVIFFFVLLLTRAMGKKELSELTAFELILLITIGDLVQQGVTQEDQSLTGAMLAVGTLGLLIVFLSWLSYRWRVVRRVIRGIAVVVVRDGRPINEAMKLERLTIDEVIEGAREQGIDDLGKVKMAVLEPDGKFSFIRSDGEEEHQDAGKKSV
ncbi:MAG TPA: YetF domain-containing protein [Actinomycetota bacterium]|nr:YetF domain-containing protein [Actinomycetota bacterium]